MLFPDKPVMSTITDLDAILIDSYHPPHDMHYSGLGASHKTFAPNKLIARVYRAYSRLLRREKVYQWFEERDFDLSQPTIPKHLFEAAVQAEFGQLPPEPVKPIEKGAAKAKPRKPKQPRKPTAPAKEPGETYSDQLVSLMQEIGLPKSGLRLSEVRTKVKLRFTKKYPNRALPEDVTFNRAYKKYKNAKDTSAK
jgi:hypothetical protein